MLSQQTLFVNRQPPLTPQIHTHCPKGKPKQQQSTLTRRTSVQSLQKEIDIDKLIGDVKLAPAKEGNYQQYIRNIRKQLQGLKQYPQANDQIKTIQLLLNSLTKKMESDILTLSRHVNSAARKSQLRMIEQRSLSPIQQFQEVSTPIVYTNFSLKAIPVTYQPTQTPQKTAELQTPVKKIFLDQQDNKEIDRLNFEIASLERILESKGIDQKTRNKKHLGLFSQPKEQKYMHSENLCPPYKKTVQHQSSQSNRLANRNNSEKKLFSLCR